MELVSLWDELSRKVSIHNPITISNSLQLEEFISKEILSIKDKVKVIAFWWYPWASKGWLLRGVHWEVSGEWSKKFISTRKSENREQIINKDLWIIFKTWNTYEIWWRLITIALIKSDLFFPDIWFLDEEKWEKIRYSSNPWGMLYNKKNFEKLNSDIKRQADIINRIISIREGFQVKDLYWKTSWERTSWIKTTWLDIKDRPKNSELLVLIDWVDSCSVLNELPEIIWDTKLQILKVLLKPELHLSAENYLFRDIFWRNSNWPELRDTDSLINFRIKSFSLESDTYVLPALWQTKDTKLIDYTKYNIKPNLPIDYVKNTLMPSLIKNKDLFLEEFSRRNQTPEMIRRIRQTTDYVYLLEEYFFSQYLT